MAFNFTELIAAEQKKQEQQTSTGNKSGFGFKTVYPFANGRFEFKFIGNEPSGLLYREVTYHEYYSDNKKLQVPCLHEMYNMDCPICNAVGNVQNVLDDKNVFSKYGFKKRGIMFAKLLGYSPENYFGDNQNPPKPGDIVLFMFPKSVISELRDLIVEYRDDIENIFTSNITRTISFQIKTGNNGFPEYAFYVKGSNVPLVIDANGNPDEAGFNQFMTNMPNLKEVKFPSVPDENIMNVHRTVVEEINRTYFGGSGANVTMPNPTNMVNETTTPVTPINTQPVVNTPVAPPVQTVETPIMPANNEVNSVPTSVTETSTPTTNTDSRGQRPACFGNNKYADECLNCPFEPECI